MLDPSSDEHLTLPQPISPLLSLFSLQVVLMAHSNNSIVVSQASKIIGHLASSSSALTLQLMAHDVSSVISSLIRAKEAESQLCGLSILASIARASDSAR